MKKAKRQKRAKAVAKKNSRKAAAKQSQNKKARKGIGKVIRISPAPKPEVPAAVPVPMSEVPGYCAVETTPTNPEIGAPVGAAEFPSEA